MHTFLDAKLMAKALRAALAERRIDVTHSDSLELVARQFGLANWNILAAKIEALRAAPVLPPAGLSPAAIPISIASASTPRRRARSSSSASPERATARIASRR